MNASSSAPEYLTTEDVARRLQRSRKWVERETRAGRIPGHKIGRHYRYAPDELDDWVRGEEG